MKLDFDLTQDDLRKYYAFHYWYSPDKKSFRIQRRLLLAGIMGAVPLVILWIEGTTEQSLIIILVVWAAACSVYGFFRAKSSLLRRVDKSLVKMIREGKNIDLLGHQSLELENDKIVCRSAFSESTFKTTVIEKFRDDSNAFYLYISSMQAIVIPKRALNAQQQSDLVKWVADLHV